MLASLAICVAVWHALSDQTKCIGSWLDVRQSMGDDPASDLASDAVSEAAAHIIHRSLPAECPLVITYESEPPMPGPMRRLLQQVTAQPRASLIHVVSEEERAKWNCSGPGMLHNETGGVDRPKAGEKHQLPDCTVFFVSTCMHNFIKIDEFLNGIESSVMYKKALSRFIIWIRDAPTPESYLFSVPATRFKFKLALTPDILPDNKGAVLIQSSCWYCNMGKPEAFFFRPYFIQSKRSGREELWPDTTFNLQDVTLNSVYPMKLSSEQCATNTLDVQRVRHLCFVGQALNFRWELESPKCDDDCSEPKLMIQMNLDLALRKHTFIPESVITLASFGLTDQTSFYKLDYAGMATRVPRKLLSPDVFVRPFQPVIWMLVGILSLFCMSTLTFFLVASPNDPIQMQEKGAYQSFLALLSYSFQYILDSLLEQFPVYMTYKTSPRIFLCFWLFASIVLGTAYKTTLFNLLTSPPTETLPQNIRELLASPFPAKTESMVKYILEIYLEDREIYTPLFNKMEITDDLDECFERCLDDDIVCLFRWSTNEPRARAMLNKKGQSRLQISPDMTPRIPLAILLSKHNILTTSFTFWVSNYVASGLRYKWDRAMELHVTMESLRKLREQGLQLGPDLDAFSVTRLEGVFYFLFLGYIMSFLTFMLEKLYNQKRTNKLKTRSWMDDFVRGKTDYIP